MAKQSKKHQEDHMSHISHVIQTSQAIHSSQGKHPKISNEVLGVVAILAIFLIVWFVVKDVNRTNQGVISSNSDSAGQASQVLVHSLSDGQTSDAQDSSLCQILVGQTTVYDATTLSASLSVGVPAYYADNTITVREINSNGCVIDVSGTSDFLAVGQVEKLGTVYATVKQVVLS